MSETFRKSKSERVEEVEALSEVPALENKDIEITDEWLRENVNPRMYYAFISNERKKQLFDSIVRWEAIYNLFLEHNVFIDENFIPIQELTEYEQQRRMHFYEKSFYLKQMQEGKILGISFEGREEKVVDILIQQHKERLVNDYKPFVDILIKGKWYNDYILPLKYSDEIKRMLLIFCIKTNANISNMQLKKDLEYIKNHNIDEGVLMENIKTAMEVRVKSDGKHYTWKALYLKEGVNV